MDFIAVYPKIEPKKNARLIARHVANLALFLGVLAAGIVNLCVGGTPWFFYVLGGSVVFWTAFLYHPLVEYTFLRKFTAVLLAACGYLILIDYLSGDPHWSLLVVPIVLFSLFIVNLAIFFGQFKRQKRNIFSIYWIFLVSLAAVIASACNLFSLTFSWPIIVLAALDGLLLVLSIFVFRQPLWRELQKKFHLH